MFVQAGGVIAANIYRDCGFNQPYLTTTHWLTQGLADKPRYKVGNTALLSICVMNIVLYALTKSYYIFRNKQKAKLWDAMTEEQQLEYMEITTHKGNKRLDFRFVH
jgi:hypothetical protein